MKRDTMPLIAAMLICFLAGCSSPESAKDTGSSAGASAVAGTTYFFGGRLIPGDGGPPIEEATFLVENGKITSIGQKNEIKQPKGAGREDLTGQTIMPVMVNLQAQAGLNNGAQYGSKNYTRESVMADLNRYAYYGVSAVLTSGTDAGDIALQIRDEQRQGKAGGAMLFTAGRGIAAVGGGPDGLGNTPIGVATAADARKAVADQAEKKVDMIKIWVDNNFGKGPKLKPDVYRVAIEEAHRHNLKAVAGVFDLADAKDLVKSGIDGLVQSIRDREVDDDLISLMKEKNVFLAPALTANEAKFIYADKPDWLGEQAMREVYPAQLAAYLSDSVTVNKFKRNPELAALRQQYATATRNLKKMAAGGVKIVLGTDSGAADTYPGYFELREMILMADAGLSPMEVIKAATSVPASILGLSDLGTLAVGKSANFLTLSNNPLEKMTNVRDIALLFKGGQEIQRSSMIPEVKTDGLKITQKDRAADAAAEVQAARDAAEARLPHYGKFPLGSSSNVHGMPIPTPKGSKAEVKLGPPDRITVSMRATAGELREFYTKALPSYKWQANGNCWQRPHPTNTKTEVLCLESANNSAVIQITEK